jgi:hypothetical protein
MVAAAVFEGLSTGTRWTLVAVGAGLALGAIYLFRRLSKTMVATGGPTYDAFQRSGSAAVVERARSGWGPSGLAAARQAWALDLVFPVIYGVLGALLAALAATHTRSLGRDGFASAMAVVAWLSLAAGAVDLLLENAFVAVGLWAEPSERAARLAKLAGLLKRALLVLVGLGLLVALVVCLAG